MHKDKEKSRREEFIFIRLLIHSSIIILVPLTSITIPLGGNLSPHGLSDQIQLVFAREGRNSGIFQFPACIIYPEPHLHILALYNFPSTGLQRTEKGETESCRDQADIL